LARSVKPTTDAEAIRAILRDEWIASRLSHDNGRIEYFEHPDVQWLGAYIDGRMVGVFLLIRDGVEMDLHVAILKPWRELARVFGRACLDHVFSDQSVIRATAWVSEALPDARNYVRRLGFRQEGFRRDCLMIGGKPYGAYLFGMLRGEWHG
jgi:RimJ/RimL family protein N-acetyltransferase